ncbi:MAG: DUF4422 domain-containing protein [Dysgonamonadaceae bacterium]|jgi:hypothetical protein|nr:DUF4422 domain-containing protein [Dysgonamonadaceae bacterium]
MTKISIYVACHKKTHFIQNEVYVPIQVGRVLSNTVLSDIIGDDTGDNISYLNTMYCEMTANYWAWKNDTASDFIGLCHYRRFFSFEKSSIGVRLFRCIKYLTLKVIAFFQPGRPSVYWSVIDVKGEKQLDRQCTRFAATIRQKLIDRQEKIDIYAPNPIRFGAKDVQTHYNMIGGSYQVDILKEIINRHYPFLFPTLLKILKGNKMCYGNMFIMQRETYNEYCSMVFDVMEKHKQSIIDEVEGSNKVNPKCFDRLSGYIAEIMTATFIEYYRLNKKRTVKYLSVINYYDESGWVF